MVFIHASSLATIGRLTSGLPVPTPALGGSTAHRRGALQRCFRWTLAGPKPPVTTTHLYPYAPELQPGLRVGEPGVSCLRRGVRDGRVSKHVLGQFAQRQKGVGAPPPNK
jgi:hypothetical protein